MTKRPPRPPQHPDVRPQNEGGNLSEVVSSELSIDDALGYFTIAQWSWWLDPTTREIPEPQNQAQLLRNLEYILQAGAHGPQLVGALRANLAMIDLHSYRYGEGELIRDASLLNIKAGFDMDTRDTSGLDDAEHQEMRRHSSTTDEYLEDPTDTNLMLAGLLTATGAVVMRDDILDGNRGGHRIHKGMMNERPVYFNEILTPLTISDVAGERQVVSRCVWVESEARIRGALDNLSDNDKDVLRKAGLELPDTGSLDYNHLTYPTRSSIIETLQSYQMMALGDEPAEFARPEAALRGPDATDKLGIPDVGQARMKPVTLTLGKIARQLFLRWRARS